MRPTLVEPKASDVPLGCEGAYAAQGGAIHLREAGASRGWCGRGVAVAGPHRINDADMKKLCSKCRRELKSRINRTPPP